jgi:hypothetical protein
MKVLKSVDNFTEESAGKWKIKWFPLDQEIKEFADRNQLESVEASALNGKGVKEAFTRLALAVSARVKNGTLVINTGVKGIQELSPFEPPPEKKGGGGCC